MVSGGKSNAVGLSFFDEEFTPDVQKTVYSKPSQRACFALLSNNQGAWTYIEGRNDDDAFTLQIDSIDGNKLQTFSLGQVSHIGAAANDDIIKTKNQEAVEFADDRILLSFYLFAFLPFCLFIRKNQKPLIAIWCKQNSVRQLACHSSTVLTNSPYLVH